LSVICITQLLVESRGAFAFTRATALPTEPPSPLWSSGNYRREGGSP
jgi:hypothetical protein